jgi:23S rRNA (pseudouridine1915-N3)-methyltransferase
MKIIIIAVGKEKDFAAAELVADYSARIEHTVPVVWKYISTSTKEQEEKDISKALDGLSTPTHIVALDEKGREFTSAKFADFMQARMNESLQSLVFIIGGSYGLSDELRSRAQMTVALSQLTFPHQLVRLILAEQIYRAFSIMKGEKYHH